MTNKYKVGEIVESDIRDGYLMEILEAYPDGAYKAKTVANLYNTRFLKPIGHVFSRRAGGTLKPFEGLNR